jgi:hypothetical protein
MIVIIMPDKYHRRRIIIIKNEYDGVMVIMSLSALSRPPEFRAGSGIWRECHDHR